MTEETATALAGSLTLATFQILTPKVMHLPERYHASLKSFSAGTGLAYVLLYLLFELVKDGAPKIHALLPLGPEPLETLFMLLLAALSANYLLQAYLEESPGLMRKEALPRTPPLHTGRYRGSEISPDE